MKVGIQGEQGSACNEAALRLVHESSDPSELVFLTSASKVIAALDAGEVDRAVLAAESPLGRPVPETVAALKTSRGVRELKELRAEVRHCIMMRYGVDESLIRNVASHAIPLGKHRKFLEDRYPGYSPIEVADTGLAAYQLAEGLLAPDTAVVALPRAALVFGLKIVCQDLPANDDNQTRFILVERAS